MLDDVAGPGMRVLLVGINPGLWSAAVNAPFARPGNRFWPALYDAGWTRDLLDARDGLAPADREHLIARGIGITNIAPRATARADELTAEELRCGARRLERDVARWKPAVVAILGIGTYRRAFARPRAALGKQPDLLSGAEVWLAPNPSGLNAHETRASLATAYRRIGIAAGLDLFDCESE